MDMEQHVKVVGIAHIVYGAFGLAIGFLVLLGVGVFALLAGAPRAGAISVLALGLIAIALFLVIALPGIIGGIGVLKYRPWGRVLTLIVGFISLLNFPIGTALGVYTIWVLMNRETEAMFASQASM